MKELLGSLELNRIYQFDCVEGMKLLPENCIDLTVTSPPYDNLRNYKGYSFDFEGVANQLFRVTKEGGVVVWVINDATIKGSESGSSFKQALYFKEIGFNIHDTMIWRKTNPIPNDPKQNRYIQSFEYMFVFSKGKPKTCNYITEKSKMGGIIAGQGTARKQDGTVRADRIEKRKGTAVKELKPLTNIWDLSTHTERSINHPAMFPNEIAEKHILSWSDENDVVLDIFTGSGTTPKMAKLNNRKWLGFEISTEYIEIANKRLDNIELK